MHAGAPQGRKAAPETINTIIRSGVAPSGSPESMFQI
jgi:hypothetical protein